MEVNDAKSNNETKSLKQDADKEALHSRWVINKPISKPESLLSAVSTTNIKKEEPVVVPPQKMEKVQPKITSMLMPADAMESLLEGGIKLERCRECRGVGVGLVEKDGCCLHCYSQLPVPATVVVEEKMDVLVDENATQIRPDFKYRQNSSCTFVMFNLEGIAQESVVLECTEKAMKLCFTAKSIKYLLELQLGG